LVDPAALRARAEARAGACGPVCVADSKVFKA
jgi:hypothetical protein